MIAYNEFTLTKRHGRIVSRKVYTFKWSNKAIAIRDRLHHPNIQPKSNLPKPILPKLSKEDRLNNLPYSDYHNKLVSQLYSNNKEDCILRQQAEKAAHELKIKRLALKQKERRAARKQQILSLKEQCKPHYTFNVVVKTKTNPEFKRLKTTFQYETIKKELEQLNLKWSRTLEGYVSVALYPINSTQECLLYVNRAA